MSVFEFVSVALSIILGLGVTRVLSSLIELVWNRSRVKLHWAPIAWAVAILVIQFQFWWNLFWLNENHTAWTNLDFLIWVATALTLVTAGNLALPIRYDEDRTDLFEQFVLNGRIGLGALALYIVMGHVIAVLYTGVAILSLSAAVAVAWLAPVLFTMLSRSRTAIAIGTAAFLVVSLGIWSVAVVQSWG